MERKQRRLLMVLAMMVAIGAAASSANAQLILYWPLDETSGTIAHDEVWKDDPTINLDGYFNGGLPVWDPTGGRIINGSQSGAIYFHGGTERVRNTTGDSEHNPILDFDREPMSVACWMRTDGVGWPSSYAFIVSKGYSWRIYANNMDGDARWRTNYGGIMNCGTTLNDGEWHHLVGCYDGEFDIRFYVDGVLRAQKTNSQPRATYDTSYNFTIGASTPQYGWGSARCMEGWIDDVSVWGIQLSPDQIQDLMVKGAGGVNIPPVVDAGPPQISHLPEDWWLGAEIRLNGAVEDQTVFGANVLSWFWEEGTDYGTLSFFAADGLTPSNNALNGIVKTDQAFLYDIVLSASDGVLEANDVFLLDVRIWGWTGEIIRYSF
ncbi:MAG: hypothetical protein GY869_04815, partial [Planctomycetes bacterium]|nr:hypothetical protein [Planctomycetota bacterium]